MIDPNTGVAVETAKQMLARDRKDLIETIDAQANFAVNSGNVDVIQDVANDFLTMQSNVRHNFQRFKNQAQNDALRGVGTTGDSVE